MKLNFTDLWNPGRKKKRTKKELFLRFLKQYLFCFFLILFLLFFARERIFINNSPSVPVGFYLKTNKQEIEKNAIVFFRPSEKTKEFLVHQGLLSKNIPFMLKRVGGIEGDHIVIRDKKLYINTLFVYEVPEKTSKGIPLHPIQKLDYILKPGEYFLIGDIKQAYDGRYFGIVTRHQIEGTGILLVSSERKRKF